MKKILCVGPQWRGSNAGGLFRALSRIGHLISVVDENYFINLSNKELKTKSIDKLFRNWHIEEFNKAIISEANSLSPDLVLVYKGAFVLPQTLKQLRNKGFYIANFYPDVSFRTHGSLLGETLPLYDHVFTTKTFGIKDMKEQLGITNATFIPHGFDPDIHRKIDTSNYDTSYFNCDVSFIGGWSEKKESLISAIKVKLPSVNIKIWGGRWENCKSIALKDAIQGKSILGDLYTLGILSSKINLGLVHEQVEGASSGDLITSRTFHIPGAGGFMLHEKTPEIDLYFEDKKEISTFSSLDELADKVAYFLSENDQRNSVAINGHHKALRSHSLDERAKQVISSLTNL